MIFTATELNCSSCGADLPTLKVPRHGASLRCSYCGSISILDLHGGEPRAETEKKKPRTKSSSSTEAAVSRLATQPRASYPASAASWRETLIMVAIAAALIALASQISSLLGADTPAPASELAQAAERLTSLVKSAGVGIVGVFLVLAGIRFAQGA